MAAPGSVRRRQRGAGLARPTVQRASLPVPLPVQPTGAECAALLKALIKHLLFQRAQIPYLYDELLRAAQEQQRAEAEAEAAAAAEAAAGGGRQRRRRRSPKGDKRLLKFLCKAEELLASIDAALAACGVPRRAFLLLGASSTKPREVFEVLLPQPAAATPHGPTAAAAGGPGHQQQGAAVHEAAPTPQAASRARPSRQQRLCQLAVRQLVVGGAELPEGTAHTVPCKLFVLLEGPPVAAAGAADTPDGAAEAAEVAVPAGFATKRQFRLSMRKGTHVRLLLGQRAEEDAEQQRAAEQAAEQQQQRQEEEGPATTLLGGWRGMPAAEISQRVMSTALVALFWVLPTFWPVHYMRHRTVYLLSSRISFFAWPLLRKPRGIQHVLESAAAAGVRGALRDIFKVVWGGRLVAVMLLSSITPLSILPLSAHLLLQLYAVLMVRGNSSLCAAPLLRDPLTRARISRFHSAMGLLAYMLPGGIGFALRARLGDSMDSTMECEAFLTCLSVVLALLLPAYMAVKTEPASSLQRREAAQAQLARTATPAP
ncbi:MAD2L1-binding isoform X2 [Chlorella sorokiniana]|uniref:MAD2L1-binding isoform X2 n=1 Tax=Chlorella sorokiniana TaxID=3076 RepID=A0A2P6TXP7_CHLSO|nr:MAD2L1-binding isoform X2 [Chlorella sorokiniana]|eukprot:PRW58844.1 MAD2L1-binding isoform X2 [Chlorella sorokiniana]